MFRTNLFNCQLKSKYLVNSIWTNQTLELANRYFLFTIFGTLNDTPIGKI